MAQREFPCRQCGAGLHYEPGTTVLKCPYCGTENEIPQSEVAVEELDYLSTLAQAADTEETVEALTVKCPSCGAESTLEPNVTAERCPFCGTAIVAQAVSTRVIKPRSLLPFEIKREIALASFRQWIASRWFAPSDLKKYAESGRMDGLYIPFWTYDCDTTSRYTGERGDNYTVTESYTDSKGRRQTRTVTRIRWHSVSGTVYNNFNDVLVLASTSLPHKYTEALEPWDLHQLVPFTPEFLSGFRAESYNIDLAGGFTRAKEIMDDTIRSSICSDIGGDHQRIHTVNTRYDHITFKHILLPIWLSAYRYREHPYRFLVNARTGEVQGERPYSWIKITLFVLFLLAVAGGAYYWYQQNQSAAPVSSDFFSWFGDFRYWWLA